MSATRILSVLAGCVLVAVGLACNAAGTYFVSDTHFGVGRDASGKWSALEDFRWHDAFVAFLDHISASSGDEAQLVILGDMLELWQSNRMQCSTIAGVVTCTVKDCGGRSSGCSEQEALARLQNIVVQHGATLRALGAFAARGKNRVVIVPGNHDAALLLPSAGALLVQAIGAPPQRVVVASSGRWLSEDGQVLAEHGHQFDAVNSFDGWPTPFVNTAGKRSMERPGGELLVQTFFNRYERQFEAIDNFGTESEGLGYAMRYLRAKGVVFGVADFAHFLLLRSTIEQRFDWLGEAPAESHVEWDIARIRKTDHAGFVLDSLEPRSPQRQVLADAFAKGELSSLLKQLTDEDIQTLCDRIEFFAQQRSQQADKPAIEHCPSKAGSDANLGYFAGKILKKDDEDLIAYLARTRSTLPTAQRSFVVYVYGHTHSAKQPRPVAVTPEWEVSVVNTGAFQRIASHEFIDSLPEGIRAAPAFLATLTLEQLPECYSFVSLQHAAKKPSAVLRYWRRDPKSKDWGEAEDCKR